MSLSVMPDKADEYRRHAQECFEAAERMNNEEERNILLHIAQTWEHLANQEEDTSRMSNNTRSGPTNRKNSLFGATKTDLLDGHRCSASASSAGA
jgi:hypothetical protein